MTDNNSSREFTQVESSQEEEIVKIVDLYQGAEKIYTRRIKGFYRRLQQWSWIPMLAAYFLLPWINLNSRQILWFDLPARKFYVFGLTFWPQDFMLLAWLLIIAAFALFAVTAFAGRVWCGFTCPQTVWTMLFMWSEHAWMGDRNKRIKMDRQPWSLGKIVRKYGNQLTWFLIAFLTGLTFVSYFNPIRELVVDIVHFDLDGAVLFWVVLFTAATYVNAGYMREQVCKYMCPYARFQASMFDDNTLIVSYDEKRGESRGARKKKSDYKAKGMGDCVDCTLCVQVCPVGIDIRDGLQYECISCGHCIDACDAVMDQMDYPRGLISFTTENRLKGKESKILRPKLIGYVLAGLIMSSAFMYTLVTRVPLEVDVIRDRDTLFRKGSDGLVENIYTVKINNKDTVGHRFRIVVSSPYQFIYKGKQEVDVITGDVMSVLVRLSIDPTELLSPNTDIEFVVDALDSDAIKATQESRFLGPR
jgi:cytochrome c oxidase accessory protein FixG